MKARIQKIGLFFMTALLMTGCGNVSNEMSADTAAAVMTEEAAEVEAGDMVTAAGGTEISAIVQDQRKLIRTVEMQIETKEFDSVLSAVQAKVQELGGYVEASSLDSGSAYYSSYNRYSNLNVRVPSEQLDGFVEHVRENANVTYLSESTEDITLQYVDTESRKTALETEQSRLLELLEKAETVEDLITVESRLSEVRYELESYASQLRTYDNQVDYSTVSIFIREVNREIKSEPKTFWEEVSERFQSSLYGIAQGARGFAVWFLGMTPYLLIWAAVIAAAVLVLRRLLYRRKKTVQKEVPETAAEYQEK